MSLKQVNTSIRNLVVKQFSEFLPLSNMAYYIHDLSCKYNILIMSHEIARSLRQTNIPCGFGQTKSYIEVEVKDLLYIIYNDSLSLM